MLYIAASLDKAGHETRIYNLDRTERYKGAYFQTFNLADLIAQLAKFKPDVVGITCPYSARWWFTKRLIKILRRRFSVPIVIGGILLSAQRHVSFGPDIAVLSQSVQLLQYVFIAGKTMASEKCSECIGGNNVSCGSL